MSIIKNPITIVKSGGGEDKLAYRISSIGNYSYENNEITSLKQSAFANDSNLTEIRCENVENASNLVFNGCTSLVNAFLPKLRALNSDFFQGCTSLTSADFPLASRAETRAFRNCTSLTTVNLPLLTRINQYVFSGCNSLITVSFPLVTFIDTDGFGNCYRLASISFPQLNSISNEAFTGCSSLTIVSFPLLTSIGSRAFQGCTALTSITLGKTSQVCTLSATNAIPASSSHHINIYVPVNLVASYRTATNWSTLYNNGYISILPIDGQLINTSITNGTFSGPVAIANNGTATITITANSGYELPTSVSVTGASYTYSNGVITLSNPVSEVNISATCPQATPSGYNLTITSGGSIGAGSDSNAYVKLNGYATRASDYDYYIVGNGLYGTPSSIYNKEGVLQSNPLNLTQISSIQIWGDSSCDYEFNSGDATEVSGGFNNRVMINLTQDSTIEIAPYIED